MTITSTCKLQAISFVKFIDIFTFQPKCYQVNPKQLGKVQIWTVESSAQFIVCRAKMSKICINMFVKYLLS